MIVVYNDLDCPDRQRELLLGGGVVIFVRLV
jgi:hypothetical protein